MEKGLMLKDIKYMVREVTLILNILFLNIPNNFKIVGATSDKPPFLIFLIIGSDIKIARTLLFVCAVHGELLFSSHIFSALP